MRLSLIVAASDNNVIGRGGQLPWRLSSDLRRFKRLTMGHPIVMGRKTYESIGRLLPGRTSIVITRRADYDGHGALVAQGLDQALALANDAEEIFVIGGGELYRHALPRAERIYLTRVHAHVEGDVFFPELDPAEWHVIEESSHPAGEKDQYDSTFLVLERS